MSDRSRELAKRGAIALAIAMIVARVLPALADALNPTAEPTPTQSAAPLDPSAPTPTASASPAPVATEPAVTYPTPTITYKMDTSDTSTPTVLEDASVTLRAPAVVKVDPRATSVAVTPIYISTTSKLLVCLSSRGGVISGIAPASGLIVDSADGVVMLSGSASEIAASLHGLRLVHAPHVSGASLAIKAVAVSKANANIEFCATPTASQTTLVKALDLGLNTVKVPVPVK